MTLSLGVIALLSITIQAAEFDPPATNIVIELNPTLFLENSTFTYSYQIISNKDSQQEIDSFVLKAGTKTVPEIFDIQAPPDWLSTTIGNAGNLGWGALSEESQIRPGTSKNGFSLKSKNPPGVIDSRSRGFVPLGGSDNFVDENTPKPRDPEQDSVHVLTIGPSTFTFTDPSSAIDRLISLKRQSVSLGWLTGDKFIRKLDRRLEKAKKALAENKLFKARKKLEQFVKELEKQRKKQLKREDDDEEDKDKAFINDNAFFLLKVNAEFIISQLPEKPKDKNEEREGKEAEQDDG